jgi:hypothetical protein
MTTERTILVMLDDNRKDHPVYGWMKIERTILFIAG